MRRLMFFGFIFLFLFTGVAVHAQLPPANSVGAVNPVTGFPTWVSDSTGLQLALCTDGAGVGAPPCASLTLTTPALGAVAGNIVEAMFYAAGNVFLPPDVPDRSRVVVAFAVEAVGADPTVPGAVDSVINSRLVRIDLDVAPLADAVYNFTSPWGAGTVTVPAGQTRGIFVDTLEVIADAPTFAGVMTPPAPVNPFIGNGTAACFGPGFLGDGVTLAPLLAPGPAGQTNFTLVGPGININSNEWTVEGKIFAPAAAAAGGFAVERGTMAVRGATATGVLVATTNLGNAMNITGVAGVATNLPMTRDAATGRFFARFPMGNVANLPQVVVNVAVLNAGTPVVGLENVQVIMKDTITIRSATFSARTGTLAVTAASSIAGTPRAPGPVLTVTGTDAAGVQVGTNPLGTIARGSLRKTGITVPPSFVTVTSARGGALTVPVTMQ